MHPAIVMGESLLALIVILAILLAIAETPLYPVAFGAVGLAALYTMLNTPHTLPKLATWASDKLR